VTQPSPGTGARRAVGAVGANERVSSGLWRLEMELDTDIAFLPGQFAMLNLTGRHALVFSRPFSILAAAAGRLDVLYRIVGRGTAALAELARGDAVSVLAPLGTPFPPRRDDLPALLLGGGVGLPPVAAWLQRYGREGDRAWFGARDAADVPWDLLPAPWEVALDDATGLPSQRHAAAGLVTDVAAAALTSAARTSAAQTSAAQTSAALGTAAPRAGSYQVMACGPLPMLRAAAALAAERGWPCWLSLEEHMGCGYGVCKGCVVPVRTASPEGWRNATCCQEGPVFAAQDICWERHRSETPFTRA